ncbi:LysR substrate-binding domain-containing protein [Amycolatopsis acidiphila]|uniref:LysR family transcriptional regulator n=1 Tax=Amycolatopsis acidiphila TaxID=715473 RepID=UPI001E5CCEAA|nr:LysR family transcriptional regulator [Amycolatopsis acidiphila]UIJ56938.1 LysR substrate-binding domain-containing protein [Amycolatopsis acidiphila]
MEIREMRAFVAVVEEGGLSAAARRLHVSQPALSQTMTTLERRLGVQLLVRSSTGVEATDAGMTLLAGARAVLARHDEAIAAVTRRGAAGGSVLRIGIPLELPGDLLSGPLAEVTAADPETRVQARHLSSAAQLAALTAGELDLALVREHPVGPDFDAMLVVEERLGVLLTATLTAKLAGPGGIPLAALAGLSWVGFPRSGSPAWYDELTAILRSHGLELGPDAPQGQELIPEVKLAAVATGGAFALAPPDWAQPLPGSVVWSALAGQPLVRRTWAVWSAHSHRRDLGRLVAALDRPGPVSTVD